VLTLAWPVLAQQFLHLFVGLSDQFLAGYFPQVPIEEQAAAAGLQLSALASLGDPAPAGVLSPLSSAALVQASWEIMSRQVAYQSAQTTANYLAWFISSYMVLISVGSTALVSRFIGAGDRRRAIRVTNQSIVVAAVLGGLGSIVGLLCLKPLIFLLQLRGHAAEYAADYLTPMVMLLAFQVVEQAGIACLVGAGDTRTGLWVLGGVAIVNLPLSWALYHGLGPVPAFGFAGIALGTGLSHALGCLAVLLRLAAGHAGLRLSPGELYPDLDLIRRLLRISIPAGVDSLSVALSQLWFLSIINQLGDVAATAHGIALRWEGLAYLSGGAFGTAAMALVGQNLGAGLPERAAHSGRVAFAIGCTVMCVMAAVFFILAPYMFLIFCPRPEQARVIGEGVGVLRLVAFAMPALASCIIFTAALRGAGDTAIPVLFTWIGFLLVRIPLAYLLTSSTTGLGLFGAWLAMFADLMVRGCFCWYRFVGGRWQSIRV
jgi:putative MATE family efflux protein